MLWRKRIVRHVERCAACQDQQQAMVNPKALLGSASVLLPAPLWLRQQTLAQASTVTGQGAGTRSSAAATDRGWWPPRAPRRITPVRIAVAASALIVAGVAAALLILGPSAVGVLVHGPSPETVPSRALPGAARTSPSRRNQQHPEACPRYRGQPRRGRQSLDFAAAGHSSPLRHHAVPPRPLRPAPRSRRRLPRARRQSSHRRLASRSGRPPRRRPDTPRRPPRTRSHMRQALPPATRTRSQWVQEQRCWVGLWLPGRGARGAGRGQAGLLEDLARGRSSSLLLQA